MVSHDHIHPEGSWNIKERLKIRNLTGAIVFGYEEQFLSDLIYSPALRRSDWLMMVIAQLLFSDRILFTNFVLFKAVL